MSDFENVSGDEFAAALVAAPASPAFRKTYARLKPQDYNGYGGNEDCMIHRGSLVLNGDFVAPGFNTLIVGDLIVHGLLDLHNPYDKGFDEGGRFIAIGNVVCRMFAAEYGKCTVIDGSLEAADLVINAYEDSGMWITGDLTTRFFLGEDIWAEVGGEASMEYGIGYCFPLGYTSAIQAIRPHHDVETSSRLLNADTSKFPLSRELLDLWRAGKPLFK